MVPFQVISDLHLESPSAYDIFDIPPKAPHLALLGDIGNVRDPGFFPFIETQLSKFRMVFFLLGNHEPYHSSWADVTMKIHKFERETCQRAEREPESRLGRFVFLNRTRYDVSDDVTVLGCTLYSHVPPENAERVNFGLTDFYQIDDWTVESHNAAHATDLAWLNAQVAAIGPGRKIVILTHHSPVTHDARAIDPAHAGSAISSGFVTDLSGEECWTNTQVAVWAFGHTHYNCDFKVDGVGGKRVVSNQRGYYFRQVGDFDVEKVVSV